MISFSGGALRNLICKVKLLYIKRCDAFNNATLGTHLGFGVLFADIPHLPHGLYGIVVTHNAVVGKKRDNLSSGYYRTRKGWST